MSYCQLYDTWWKKIESKEESSVNRQPVQELTQAEQDKVRERINDIINEQLGDISEKTEAQLDKISNTKILELNEYADTVMNEINKNHNETVFYMICWMKRRKK